VSSTPTIPKERPFAEELKDPQVGDLIKLYNLYREIIIEEPAVIGIYMGRGNSGQFSYYEIHVIKDMETRGFVSTDRGNTQRYLINDFLLCKCS